MDRNCVKLRKSNAPTFCVCNAVGCYTVEPLQGPKPRDTAFAVHPAYFFHNAPH